jgi:hypothetical protein
MLMQNYIKIYENASGEITLAYAASSKDDHLNIGDIQYISINTNDAHTISKALCDLADRLI